VRRVTALQSFCHGMLFNVHDTVKALELCWLEIDKTEIVNKEHKTAVSIPFDIAKKARFRC